VRCATSRRNSYVMMETLRNCYRAVNSVSCCKRPSLLTILITYLSCVDLYEPNRESYYSAANKEL